MADEEADTMINEPADLDAAQSLLDLRKFHPDDARIFWALGGEFRLA